LNNAVDLNQAWTELPLGARFALQEQWEGLAAGGLACGSSVVDSRGNVVASGRNHAYDAAGSLNTRGRYALQHNRLAHAELNALALLPTEADHGALTLWATQHPCFMCAAAGAFIGIGRVVYVADDLSDDSPNTSIVASRRSIPYAAFGNPLWWTVSNLLFLHNPAVRAGNGAASVKAGQRRCPRLASLALELAKADCLGKEARDGKPLPAALARHQAAILECVDQAPR
jgi:tRNA(Arg) A34 adenosine deaminase TadA